MLHQCPCGGIVSFNGLFDGELRAEAIRLHGFGRLRARAAVSPTWQSSMC
jgi:hypothetical protein